MRTFYLPNEIINKILSYRPAHPLVAVLKQERSLLINIKIHYEMGNDDFLLTFVEDKWHYCFVRFRHPHPLVAVLKQEWYLLINIKMHYETGNDDFLLNVVEDRWHYCFSRFDKKINI